MKAAKLFSISSLLVLPLFAGYTLENKLSNIDTKLLFFGFAQFEAVGGQGMQEKTAGSVSQAGTAVAFRAQRVRLGWKYFSGRVAGKVFLDFNQNTDNVESTDGASLNKMVKDAFVSYKFDDAAVVKVGLIKQPHGMSFTMPGWNLDIAERGFDKALMLERNSGIMISGRDMGLGNNGKVNGLEMGHERQWKGFGYDLMIANQSNRNGGVAASSAMGGNSYVARAMFDYTQKLHTEISYAISENADGLDANASNGVAYTSMNIGIDSSLQKLSMKAEYTNAYAIKGVTGVNETAVTATLAYFVSENVELVTKYIWGEHSNGLGATPTSLSNTYLGFNLFLHQPKSDFSRSSKRKRNQHKVLFNYILANGDTQTWTGLKGYTSNAFIAQYQFKF